MRVKHYTKHFCIYIFAFILFFVSCQKNDAVKTEAVKHENKSGVKATSLTNDFKAYWYDGNAELTSYKIQQARYGELRAGNAVLIYVTEPFLKTKQVKANKVSKESTSVLKLNKTTNFLTGIYPYSILSSTFYPVSNNSHALKVSASIQEWCGHVYTQLNNRDDFEVELHSYFESEADTLFKVEKHILENEIWTKLRVDPESLPTGEIKIIPSLAFSRLKHVAIKPYNATASLEVTDTIATYAIVYKDLVRSLKIFFEPNFPYTITGWEETYKSGFASNAKLLTSTATKIKTIKLPYWQKNATSHVSLRDTLGL